MATKAYQDGWDMGIGKTAVSVNPYEYGTLDFHSFVKGYNEAKEWVYESSQAWLEFLSEGE